LAVGCSVGLEYLAWIPAWLLNIKLFRWDTQLELELVVSGPNIE